MTGCETSAVAGDTNCLIEIQIMNQLVVQQVCDDDLDSAFSVLTRVADWLEQMGRRQRISNTTWQTYQSWQRCGVNFAVLDANEIAGIFSLPREKMIVWPMLGITQPVVWLRALATDPSFRGQGIGEFAIQSAVELNPHDEPLYLDCVSGFLPTYYRRHGFKTIAQQTRSYPNDPVPFDITLMRYATRSMDKQKP